VRTAQQLTTRDTIMSTETEKNDAKTESLLDASTPTPVDAVISEPEKDATADVHLVEKKLEGLAVGLVTTKVQATGSTGDDSESAQEQKPSISHVNEDSATGTQLGSDDLKPDSTQDSQSEYLFRPPQTIFSSFRSTHRSRSYEQMVSRQPSRRKFENKDDVRDIHDRSYRNILDPRRGTPERFMTITAQQLYGSNPPSLEELRVSDYALGLIRPLSLGDAPKQSLTAGTSHPIDDDEPVDGRPATPTAHGLSGGEVSANSLSSLSGKSAALSHSRLPSVRKEPASEQAAEPTSLISVSGTPINPSPAMGGQMDLGTCSTAGEVWQRQCRLCPTVRRFHSADELLAASDLCEGCEAKRKTSC